MTVGELLKYIEDHNIPHTATVVYQRIEDIYFENHGWYTIKKPSEAYYNAIQWNKDIDSGKYLDKEEYPNMTEEHLTKIEPQQLAQMKNEYVPVFSAVLYDLDHLYLDAHY